MRGMLLLLVGCSADVAIAPAKFEECEAPTPAEVTVPRNCWVDDEMCPPEATPWAECSRRYVCDVEQPDGIERPACVRGIDCDCLRSWDTEGCDAGDFEMPTLCAYQP